MPTVEDFKLLKELEKAAEDKILAAWAPHESYGISANAVAYERLPDQIEIVVRVNIQGKEHSSTSVVSKLEYIAMGKHRFIDHIEEAITTALRATIKIEDITKIYERSNK